MIATRTEAAATVPVRYQMAVLAERARVARELHDGLLQDAMTIALHLRAILPDVRAASETAATALIPIVELAEHTTAEARRVIIGMRRSATGERLAAAVEAAVRRAVARARLVVSIAVSGTDRPMPDQVHDAVLRIVREAATNVVRHAGARTIRLAVVFGKRILRVSITDDGTGFDPDRLETPTGHFGLIGMRERASAVGGLLHICSGWGEGTTVTIAVPWHQSMHSGTSQVGDRYHV